MLSRLRRDDVNLTLPLAQFGGVVAVLAADNRWGVVAGLAVLVASGLFGWLRSVQHARLIHDTPTARIASAAQGYTELRGRGKALPGTPLLSPVNGLPLLWYRVTTERRQRDGKWQHLETLESDASFLLDDGSGLCAVDPEGAHLLVRRRDVFRRGELRHTQWSLIAGDAIYVIGEFATLGGGVEQPDLASRTRDLLAQWKADRSALLARFDLDGNGELDMREWELARAQARREAAREQRAASTAEAHLMRRAPGRLYLISDLDPARIAWRYRLWGAFHLALFLGAAATGAWFVEIGVL